MEFDNLHQILRSLYEQMMPLCEDMAGVAKGIAGLGALFYVAYRVWQSLARAEPIDVFPMLRPFAIGLCIMFFPTVVLGTINSILSPVVQGTAKMLEAETLDMNTYRQQKDKLEYEAMMRNPETAYLMSDVQRLLQYRSHGNQKSYPAALLCLKDCGKSPVILLHSLVFSLSPCLPPSTHYESRLAQLISVYSFMQAWLTHGCWPGLSSGIKIPPFLGINCSVRVRLRWKRLMEKTQLLKNTIYVKFMASCASLSFILPPQIILRPVLSQPSINSPPVSILYEHSNTHSFKKSRKIFGKTSLIFWERHP